MWNFHDRKCVAVHNALVRAGDTMDKKFSRRNFIGGTAASSVVALTSAQSWQPDEADIPDVVSGSRNRFFSTDEATLMQRLVDRVIPADELGPGAHEAGVTFFIDRQLAGSYGAARDWYMQGPWPEGADTQGYQSRLTPAEMYRTALAAIDDHCRQTFGHTFATLSTQQQDEVIGALENEAIDLNGAPRKTFFDMLLQNVTEGYFCDPVYGGNRNMAGWKMIGFPGAHYDYRAYVARHGESFDIAPVGLLGGPAWEGRR